MANANFLTSISLGTNAQLITYGSGSPESVETAPVGSMYLDGSASGASSVLWVKGSGVGNTGWSQLAAVAIPGGSDTYVQFNDAGVLGGDAQFTWNKTTNALSIGSSGTAGSILFKNAGQISLEELNSNGTDTVSIKAPSSVSASYTITLPPQNSVVNNSFLCLSSTGQVYVTNDLFAYDNTTTTFSFLNSNFVQNFLSFYDGGSNLIFSIGQDPSLAEIATFHTGLVLENGAIIYGRNTSNTAIQLFTLYSDDVFYFGPYDNGVDLTGLEMQIRYGRGNFGSDSAILIAGADQYIEIPLKTVLDFPVQTGVSNPKLIYAYGVAATHTAIIAGDVNDVLFELNRNIQFTTGSTISSIRSFYIKPPNFTATAATQTITSAATLAVSGAPVKSTNVAITNTSAFLVEAGAVSTATNSYGIYVNAQTGATNNYAAGFTGGFVGIGTVAPTGTLDVVSSVNSSNAQFLVENHAANNTPAAISYTKSRGSKSSTTSVNTLDYLGIFLFRAADAVNTLRQIGTFGVRANGTIASNSVPSEMFFGVSPGWNSTDAFADATIQLLLSADTTVAINSTTKGTGQFNVFNGSASRVATIIRGTTSQSADLLQLQTVTPTTVFSVSANGDTTIAPIVRTTGSPNLVVVTGPAHTSLTASTEATDINFNLARTVQFATGALTTQRAMRIQAPTYGFVGASTLSHASTVSITGAPVKGTNTTLTNTSALRIEAGGVSTAANAYSLYVAKPSGATANYTAYFEETVGIGFTTPSAYLHIKAGTTAASTAPLKIENGSLLTSPEAGVIERSNRMLYFTPNTKRGVLQTSSQENITMAADVNNYAIDDATNYLAVDSDGTSLFTGIAGTQYGGRVVYIVCLFSCGQKLTISHQHASSSAANRFDCVGGSDLLVNFGGMAICVYDSTENNWKVYTI